MNLSPYEPLLETVDADQSRLWQVENEARNQVILSLNKTALVHASELAQRDAELAQSKAELALLKVQLETLRRLKFGRSAERFDPTQQQLFDESVAADLADVEAQLEAHTAAAKKPSITRAKPVRKPLPEHLPRVICHLPAASCNCAKCGGDLHQIGEEVSEKLDQKSAKYFVLKTIRPGSGLPQM